MPLSRKEFMKFLYGLAENMGIAHHFYKTKKTAGKDFYYYFLKRLPELSLEKPEPTIFRVQLVSMSLNFNVYIQSLKNFKKNIIFHQPGNLIVTNLELQSFKIILWLSLLKVSVKWENLYHQNEGEILQSCSCCSILVHEPSWHFHSDYVRFSAKITRVINYNPLAGLL